MKKQLVPAFVVSFIAFTSGCDSPAVDQTPFCDSEHGGLCEPPGFPFVEAIGTLSDACLGPGGCATPITKTTATLTQPQPGTACLEGTVAGRDGFSWLIVAVSRWNQAGGHIVDALDAASRGITQLRFTLDRPPVAGITMFATAAWRRDCPNHPADCMHSFELRTGPRSATLKVMDRSETVTAPFTDFRNEDPNVKFDTSQLVFFIYRLGAGDYDFCLSDFTFLDASGNLVDEPGEIDAGVMSDATQGS